MRRPARRRAPRRHRPAGRRATARWPGRPWCPSRRAGRGGRPRRRGRSRPSPTPRRPAAPCRPGRATAGCSCRRASRASTASPSARPPSWRWPPAVVAVAAAVVADRRALPRQQTSAGAAAVVAAPVVADGAALSSSSSPQATTSRASAVSRATAPARCRCRPTGRSVMCPPRAAGRRRGDLRLQQDQFNHLPWCKERHKFGGDHRTRHARRPPSGDGGLAAGSRTGPGRYAAGGAETWGNSSSNAPRVIRWRTSGARSSNSSCSTFWVWPYVPSRCG